MVAEIYNAFRAAGVDDEKAQAAATAMSGINTERLTKMEDRLDKIDAKLTGVHTDLIVLKWMMGLTVAGILSLVLKAFFT